MDGGGLYLWNSCEPSSPSVWTIRQCLKMAASLLNSAASSFRQHRNTHVSGAHCWTSTPTVLRFPSSKVRPQKSTCPSCPSRVAGVCTSSTLRLPLAKVMLKRIFSTSMANSLCCRLRGGSSSSGTPSHPALAASRESGQHRPRTASSWLPWTRTGPEDSLFTFLSELRQCGCSSLRLTRQMENRGYRAD